MLVRVVSLAANARLCELLRFGIRRFGYAVFVGDDFAVENVTLFSGRKIVPARLHVRRPFFYEPFSTIAAIRVRSDAVFRAGRLDLFYSLRKRVTERLGEYFARRGSDVLASALNESFSAVALVILDVAALGASRLRRRNFGIRMLVLCFAATETGYEHRKRKNRTQQFR